MSFRDKLEKFEKSESSSENSQNHMHLFNVGDTVTVKLFDWSKDSSTKRSVSGRIVSKVSDPVGYDVELNEPAIFTGYIPFPRHMKTAPKITQSHAICKTIYVRDFCVSVQLKEKMLKFIDGLVFKTVNVVHTPKPEKCDYINVYLPNGRVETVVDDDEVYGLIGNDVEGRLAFKVPHFYGFTYPDTQFIVPEFSQSNKKEPTKGGSIHFVVNRNNVPNFYEGARWDKYDFWAFKAQAGQIVCGKLSSVKTNKPPSFDYWFVSSIQFLNFCKLLSSKYVPKSDQMQELLDLLVLPKNDKNLFVPHEPYISRYIYAAIYLILTTGTTKLPDEWELPRRSVGGSMMAFEEWWPKVFMNQ